jgi:hypothetical protein
MSRKTTLATGRAGFFTAPLMGAAFLVRHLATLTGNLALLLAVHGREPSIFFAHNVPLQMFLKPTGYVARPRNTNAKKMDADSHDRLCNARALPTRDTSSKGLVDLLPVPYRQRSGDFRRSEGRTKKRKRWFSGIQIVGFERREAGSDAL